MINNHSPLQQQDMTSVLLKWYRENQRDLPWRHERHPYAVWISEIMAQQTRIAALIPFYERFMDKFPDLETLAAADVNQVLHVWAGLGYYRRAHHLHQAAQQVMRDFGGRVPDEYEDLSRLPGIGDYTASAILSIAFNQPFVPIDGNISRVYARLECCDTPTHLTSFKKAAKSFFKAFIPLREPGDFVQALMELGALVCLPKNPRCHTCPLSIWCRAKNDGRQEEFPVRSKAPVTQGKQLTVVLVINGRREVLLRQRQEDLLKGLWEYYHFEGWLEPEELITSLEEFGYTVNRLLPLGRTSHAFSHLVWHMQGYACLVPQEHPVAGYAFIPARALESMALPAALRFFTEWFLGNEWHKKEETRSSSFTC